MGGHLSIITYFATLVEAWESSKQIGQGKALCWSKGCIVSIVSHLGSWIGDPPWVGSNFLCIVHWQPFVDSYIFLKSRSMRFPDQSNSMIQSVIVNTHQDPRLPEYEQ